MEGPPPSNEPVASRQPVATDPPAVADEPLAAERTATGEPAPGRPIATSAPASTEDVLTGDFPWPPAEDESIALAIVRTWRESSVHPKRFFRALPIAGGIGPALLYYLPLGVLVAGITLFWEVLLPPMDVGGDSQLGRLLAAQNATTPLVDFLLSPIYLLGVLFLTSGFVHAVLAMIGGARHGFRTTVRVFCYAYSPAILAVIPRAGGVIGSLWILVLGVIGLREAHRTSTFKALVAIVLPVFIAMMMIVFALILVLSGFLLLGPVA